MTITFWDKTTLVVSRDQWLQIKKMRDDGMNWIVLPPPVEMEFDPRTIAKVSKGGEPPLPPERRIAAGDDKPRKFDPNAPGYKSFLAMRDKLSNKLGARP